MKSLLLPILGCGLSIGSAHAQITISSGATLTVSHESSVESTAGSFVVEAGGTLRNDGRIVVVDQADLFGTLATEVKGERPGEDYGVLVVGDEVGLGGDLVARYAPGYTPPPTLDLEIVRYAGATGAFAAVDYPSADPEWEVDYGPLGSPGIVFVRLGLAPLPVTWLGFDAAAAPAGVQLDWATATEIDSDFFDVERARDPGAEGWVGIGQVAAAGRADARSDYGFLDADPGPAGTVYYRLRQVDTDGSFDYSETRAVVLSGDAYTLSVFPNPVTTDALTLAGVRPGVGADAVTLRSVTGQAVARFSAAELGAARLALPTLASGVYFVEVVYGDGEVAAARFVRR